MTTISTGSHTRPYDNVDTTRSVDLVEYFRKAAADDKRWMTGQAKFQERTPWTAYFHESPLLRLPAELRLNILEYVLYDPLEIPFIFQGISRSAVFCDALRKHAVRIPSTFAQANNRPLAWYPLHWFGPDPCIAPNWKDQVFVKLYEHKVYPKRLNARKAYLRFKDVPSHRRKICSHCRSKNCDKDPWHRADGQVLRVCKGIYYEALPLLYKLNTFYFANAYEMGAVLHSMGPGRMFIRYIDVKSPIYHGGALWDYLMPCRNIRQLYFLNSHACTMYRGCQVISCSEVYAAEFFGSWILRGGEAFFDMVRNRDRGPNDPSELLYYQGRCNDDGIGETFTKGDKALLSRVKATDPASCAQSMRTSVQPKLHYLPVLAIESKSPCSAAYEHFVWKDNPLGPEKVAPSFRSEFGRLLWRAALYTSPYLEAKREWCRRTLHSIRAVVPSFEQLRSKLVRAVTVRNAVALLKYISKDVVPFTLMLAVGLPCALVAGILSVAFGLGIIIALILVTCAREAIETLKGHVRGKWKGMFTNSAPSARKQQDRDEHPWGPRRYRGGSF